MGEAVRVGGGEQVEHHRVAGDGDAVDLLWGDGGLGGHVPDELGEGPPHRGGQLRPLALEGRLDAGDHIGAPGPLGVGAAGLGQLDALLVEEEGGQGGGADVQGHAVVGKGGGQVELGHFPGEADLALAGVEEPDGAVALHFGAAGQAHPLGELLGGEAGNLRRGGGG